MSFLCPACTLTSSLLTFKASEKYFVKKSDEKNICIPVPPGASPITLECRPKQHPSLFFSMADVEDHILI